MPFPMASVFGRKPWTIVVRGFGRNEVMFLWSFYSSLEGAMNLNSAPLEIIIMVLHGIIGIPKLTFKF